MAYSESGRLQETRDGNLSNILSQIRDYGPAILGPAREPLDSMGPLEPLESSQADIPALPGRSGSETMLNLPPPPAVPTPWRPIAYMAAAVLAAILVTGAVIAALYRAPMETGLQMAPNGDPVLREGIAALQTSISKLAERVETIAAADKAPEASGERLDVSDWVQLDTLQPPLRESAMGERPDLTIGQTADPRRPGGAAKDLEVKLDTLAQRLDAMAEKMLRLTSETERSLAQILAVSASPGAQRMAPPLAEPNTTAARPVAADPLTQPATLPPAPDPPATAMVPITGANPHSGAVGALAIAEDQAKPVNPGAQVTVAEPVGVRTDPQVVEPVDAAASHRSAPTLPLAKAEQQKWQRLGALLGEEITSRADAVTARRVREGHVIENSEFAAPAAAGNLAPLIASEKNGFAKREIPTFPGVGGAAAVAPPELVVPAVSGPKAPPAVAGGEWFINLIVVRSKSTALALQRTYRGKGVDAQIVSLGRNGPFGVRVSGLSSRRDALERAPAIKTALGIQDVWIARR